jgi:hypothetical protein
MSETEIRHISMGDLLIIRCIRGVDNPKKWTKILLLHEIKRDIFISQL